ncbi:SEC8 [Sanghuangporus sanghuang]
MSRQQPFPSSSSRRQNNSHPPVTYDARFEGTPPLSVGRPQSRPMTPSSSGGSSTIRPSPARPARSERRPRHASQYSITSISSRDIPYDGASFVSQDRAPSRSQDTISDGMQDDQTPSPVALKAVLNAFQQAGAQRKRAMTNGTLEREKERERELEEEAQRQRRLRDKVTGRRVNGKAKAVGNIDSVLDRIEDDWAFVADPDFNPVDLALQLLESSTSGKDIKSFRQTKHMLSKALKGSVDKYYQAFAAALPHHAYVLSRLDATQKQIVDARVALQEAKDALGTKRSDLVQLSVRGQTIEEMLGLLDEIEHLKTVPESLESLMSEKRLLQAAGLLVRSLRISRKPEMLEIGAVSDLRSYLISQETSLRDILIDELHSHLFLKSFWCENRWTAYIPNQATLPEVEYDKEVASFSTEQSPSLSGSSCAPRLKKFLNDLATKANDPPLDPNEVDMRCNSNQSRSFSVASLSSLINREQAYNPERDSFTYLETLLESLAVLGKLGSALDIISQRLSTEIYTLVDQTIDEVHERAELSQRSTFFAPGVRPSSVYVFAIEDGSAGMSMAVTASSLRLAALESMERQTDHEILRDLFWTLYSKLDAVTQGLRVVYEVSNRIGSRRDFKDSSGAKPGNLFPLAEIWLPIQSEVRTLLNDYLSDEEKGRTAGRNPISSINEILREAKFNRDRGKQVFRFADADSKIMSKSLRAYEDELNHILRDTVPGLVQGALETAVQTMLSQLGNDDRLLGADHHRLLVRPDAFHVSVLFQPTLAFLTRVADVLPPGLESTRASTELLDDFVLNVYLPQLEEKSTLLFHNIVTGHDAFLVDPASVKLSPQPLLKACTQLMALINSLCAMLRTTPFHRDNYSRLILSVIIQFYQRCSDRFQDVVSRNSLDLTDTRLLVAARWAQQEELGDCISKVMDEEDGEDLSNACNTETRIELGLMDKSDITKEDLLGSVHDLSFLSSLYHSITWFVDQLRSLRSSSEDVTSPSSATSSMLPLLPTLSINGQLQLPLSTDMGERFGSLILTYEQLARIVLFTIRIDIRCRAIYYLTAALRHGNYRIDQEDSEPDPHVIDLNTQLGQADECICTTLPEKEQRFVFEGLEALMEELLISNARSIRFANVHGIRKILRNIIAVKQNLKTLSSYSPKSEFDRAREFYGLFSLGPQGLLENIKKEKKFTFEESQAMLNLQCGVDQTTGQAGVNQASDRDYSMYVIELHGLDLEHSSGEPTS